MQGNLKAAANAPSAKMAGPKMGLRTPLLLKNAFSSGLTKVLAGRNLSTPAPAVTVMEVHPVHNEVLHVFSFCLPTK